MSTPFNEVVQLVSKQLRSARKRRDLTQQEVADQLGVTQSQYAHYESGRTLIGIDQIVKLQEVFDVPVAFFFGVERLPADLSPTTQELVQVVEEFESVNDRLRVLDFAKYVSQRRNN